MAWPQWTPHCKERTQCKYGHIQNQIDKEGNMSSEFTSSAVFATIRSPASVLRRL